MDLHTFNILSICSGVGGLELGIELAVPNARTVCYVEGEAYCCEVLAKRMEENAISEAPIWTDIKTFDGKPWCGIVDCLAGGYPCQPFSVAGKKLGDKDPRHLWPHVARLVYEIKPPICFFENVGGHLRLGFESVANDLQAMGYQVKAGLFTAEEVGAPHKRERLFILAYNNQFGRRDGGNCINERHFLENTSRSVSENNQERGGQKPWNGEIGKDLANSFKLVCERCVRTGSIKGQPEKTPRGRSDVMANPESAGARTHQRGIWEKYNCQSIGNELENPECVRCGRRNDGMAGRESGETKAPRSLGAYSTEDGLPFWPPKPEQFEEWHKIPAHLKPAVLRMDNGLANRVDRIRACGNGVVPLVAAYAWRTLSSGMYIKQD